MVVYNPKLDKYLVLEYDSYWGLVKGLMEEGEDEKETAERELKEETGITKFEFQDFKHKITYYYKKNKDTVYKEVTFFLAFTSQKEIKISNEHNGYKWADFEEAYKLVKFKNTREVLKEARDYINLK